ncbi:MAG: dockerin type I repeat-containing protein [candidate division Zixibacteria bacterium]|nr:dockerin type I repeat-containing protein [candidate division Zixibacteria bacterium]
MESCSAIISQNSLIQNCAVYNSAIGYSSASGTFSHNLLIENRASSVATIGCYANSSPLIVNNTLDRNYSATLGSIACNISSSPQIKNTIIANELACYGIYAMNSSFPTITYCDVWNNALGDYYGCTPGAGCISADPIFCDTASDNYYLFLHSPCLGTGEGGVNIGAFGVGCSISGDANGDGVINSADISYLINYLFVNGPAPQPWQAGDANCDGTINSADVAYLINYLFVGGPPPGC